MREILFRGKDGLGYWHIGSIVHKLCENNTLTNYYANSGMCNHIIKAGDYYIIDESGEGFWVSRATVGEFTGLTDKNGTRIIEGDIVRYTTIDDFVCHSLVGIGEYQQDGSCGEYSPTPCYGAYVEVKAFKCLRACEYFNPDLNKYDYWQNLLEVAASCEVIGNIHDNPKLLEGGD